MRSWLRIDVENYSNNEKIFYPPKKLGTANTPLVKATQTGTLSYYAPRGDVALFYGSFGSASGLYELGRAVQGAESIKNLSGTMHSGHTVEKIRLAEKNINYCTGCLACISDPGSCVQQDDRAEIHKQMLAADVIVLGTPVYFHVMNGQMKVFIDRVCPIYTMLNDKDFYYAVSCAGGSSQVESSVESLKVFTRSFTNAGEKGVMSVSGKWDGGQVEGTQAGKEAYEMGKNV